MCACAFVLVYACLCVHACACVLGRACFCRYACAGMPVQAFLCVRALHACFIRIRVPCPRARACSHACVRGCMGACMRGHFHKQTRARLHARVRLLRAFVCTRACARLEEAEAKEGQRAHEDLRPIGAKRRGRWMYLLRRHVYRHVCSHVYGREYRDVYTHVWACVQACL